MATKILQFNGSSTGLVADPSYAYGANGIWTYDGTYNRVSKIIDVGGAAIADYLQGFITNQFSTQLYQYAPFFGGIAPDNSATAGPDVIQGAYSYTTTMPNSNAPYVTHLADASFQGIWKVSKIESDGVIWLEDPFGLCALLSGTFFMGASTNLGTMKKVSITNSSRYSIGMPGMKPQTLNTPITIGPNQEGIVEPFVIIQNDGDLTITITQ